MRPFRGRPPLSSLLPSGLCVTFGEDFSGEHRARYFSAPSAQEGEPFLWLLLVFFKESPDFALGTTSGSDGPQVWLTPKVLCLPPTPSHLAVRAVTADTWVPFVTLLH